MSNESFRPAGNTVLVSVSSSTATTATQMAGPVLYLSNPSSIQVFVAFGTSSIQAGNPTTAGAPGLSVPSAFAEAFNIGPSSSMCWVSACTSAGSASIYLTAGTGQ